MKGRQLRKVSMHYRFPDGNGWREYKDKVTAETERIKADYLARLEIEAEPFEKYEHKGFDIEMREKESHALEEPLKQLFALAGCPNCVYCWSDFESVEKALPPGKTLKRKFETLYIFARHVVDAQ